MVTPMLFRCDPRWSVETFPGMIGWLLWRRRLPVSRSACRLVSSAYWIVAPRRFVHTIAGS
jgi:hypothetical protein